VDHVSQSSSTDSAGKIFRHPVFFDGKQRVSLYGTSLLPISCTMMHRFPFLKQKKKAKESQTSLKTETPKAKKKDRKERDEGNSSAMASLVARGLSR
jgi:hypothetical protein